MYSHHQTFELILINSLPSPVIQPFPLYALSASEAHLCPVRALAEWISASEITTGYLFRKFASGDRVAEANQPIVGIFAPVSPVTKLTLFFRHLNASWNCSVTTFLILAWTLLRTALIRFVEVVVNISTLSIAGPYTGFVSGEAGVLSSPA